MSGRTCTCDGCDRPHYGRGLCREHYEASPAGQWAAKKRAEREARWADDAAELDRAVADGFLAAADRFENERSK